MDALEQARNRAETVERKLREQAVHAANLESKLTAVIMQVEGNTELLSRLKPQVELNEKHFHEACGNIC